MIGSAANQTIARRAIKTIAACLTVIIFVWPGSGTIFLVKQNAVFQFRKEWSKDTRLRGYYHFDYHIDVWAELFGGHDGVEALKLLSNDESLTDEGGQRAAEVAEFIESGNFRKVVSHQLTANKHLSWVDWWYLQIIDP